NEFIKKIIMGFLISFIGLTIMSTSYELAPGIVFDSRAVLISITGMFIGFIPTLIAGSFMILYRVFIGGPGAFTGVLWIIVAGAMGLLWRRFRLKNKKFDKYKITWIELYLFSLLVQVVMVGLMLTLPGDIRGDVISQVSFALISIYPLGSLLVALFTLTQRTRYFQHLKTIESEIQYRNLFQKSKTIMFLLDCDTGDIYDANEKAIEIYGYSLEEFKMLNIKHINTLSSDEVQAEIDKARSEEKNYFEFKHRLKNGDIVNVEVHSGPIELNDKTYLLTSVYDITDRIEQEKQFKDVDEKLKATLLSVGEGIAVIDSTGKITILNNRARALLSDKSTLIGKKIFDVFRIYSNANSLVFKDIILSCIYKREPFKSDGTYSLITNDDDTERFIEFTVSPINYKEHETHGAILVMRDTTIERANQDEIRFISNHDYLTSLYNRFYFEEQLERLDTSRQLPITLILGDLNGLKLLNDSFGHLEGDNLLIEVGSILKKATRAEDIVARWGGDEFVILLPQTKYEDAQIVYQRIKDLCQKSMYKPITPSISLGCAVKTTSDEDIYDILKIAEERMYREKLQEGKSMRNELIVALENTLFDKSNELKEYKINKIKIAEKFALKLNLNQDETYNLTLLARLHDIGKISISDKILRKSGKLTKDERKIIKTHPDVGRRIVQSIPELQHLGDSIYYHHEHFDGTGYPDQLKGEEIPLLARTVTIIDAFEVMTSGRIYQQIMSQNDAIVELQNKSGQQFDPNLVIKFIEMYKEHK
ncbi:MAG: diguanylate cyclase, partial [Candidatus Izimaplasma sp.]|nr:diguanylate cyclase [Candidatus Izimaplasma bacterium]